MRLRIAADCPVGEHRLRLRTASTLSTFATFWVTQFPSVEEKECGLGKNDTLATAEPVALDTTVAGQLESANVEDLDVLRFDAKRAQRIGIEADEVRLSMIASGDAEHDWLCRVLDAQGKELTRGDDNPLHRKTRSSRSSHPPTARISSSSSN